MIPRVVVAAPSSGAGKTTVAVGLMAALRQAGHTVAGFKVGPDYIDPGFHAVATGRPGRNLDPMLSGEERVAPLFAHGCAGADIAVVEGVMGLYDGALGTEGYSSTAHVAKLLQAPVVLVVDASAAGRSVGAVVAGFVAYDTGVRIVGVILNKVGSDRHEAEVRAGVAPTGIPVLGVLRRDASVTVPSRHLGLVPADEQRGQALAAVDAAAALVRQGVDLEAFVAAARAAMPLETSAWDASAEVVCDPDAARPVIAMAGGPVFSFRYTETAELLTAAGAEVISFDPLLDPLPDRTAGLYLGGGFPEMHAEALSANVPLRREVAALVDRGLPVVAECAGLLYLCKSLDGHEMTGVLPAVAEMTSRLTLGYRTAVAATTSAWYDEGRRVRGHEFHRTAVTTSGGSSAWYLPDGPEGFATANLHASYLHVHWTATPDVPARFVAAAAVHA
ncbi:cobyrinate a,c-diamide synthase [Kribbella deserti]|uniref:Hydrogenobyrinate a,c-diamide synthase n=1 Tax=Kribbella deserti TaxID=1926257 RepID=A0ABV6QKR9_9ACTN